MGGAILYDASRAGNARAEFFDADYWLKQGVARSTPAGRGQALFIEHADRRWVLRHYRRGGLVARISRDRYLWTGADRTRPFSEWRLLAELHAEGLPVPAPVGARYRRGLLFYRGDLITERIPDAEPLSARLTGVRLPAAGWQAVGRCIRRFHDAGVFHADLNAHNILLNTADEVFLIDFDRGQRRAPGVWRAGNLKRLRRSLDKINRALPAGHFTEQDWQALAAGYDKH